MSAAALQYGLAMQRRNITPPEPDVKETLGLKMWDIYDLLHREDLLDEDNLPLKYVFAAIIQIIKRCKSGYVPCNYKSKILSRLDCIKRIIGGLRNEVNSSIVAGSKYQDKAQDYHERMSPSINSNWISASLKINCKEWWPSKIFIDPNKGDEYQYTNVGNILKTYAPEERATFLDKNNTITMANISKNTSASPTSVVESPYGFLDEPEASIVPPSSSVPIQAENVTLRGGGKGRKSKRAFLKRHQSIKKYKRRTNKKSNRKNRKSKNNKNNKK